MREYVIAAYELDEATVYPPAASEEDFRVCATCNQAGTATDNPLLECVAQCKEAHYRMRCVGLDYMPGSWLCAPCVAIPVHVIRQIIGKRLLADVASPARHTAGLALPRKRVQRTAAQGAACGTGSSNRRRGRRRKQEHPPLCREKSREGL